MRPDSYPPFVNAKIIDPDPGSPLEEQARRIRASGLLGDGRLLRLFDFLLEGTRTGRVPKEVEVAHGVFERGAGFDVAQDALVRVYVHKLRRKLEDYHAGKGAGDAVRVVIPKGEYRLAIEPAPRSIEETPEPSAPAPARGRAPDVRRHRRWLTGSLIASLVVNLVLLALAYPRWHRTDPPATLRSSPLWAPLLNDDRPIVILLGDYYIFGETDGAMDVQRLIREFSINSHEDLAEYLQLNPKKVGRYEDISLSYLPTSTAFVLRNVIPILQSSHRPLTIALVSDLSPELLKSADIVYVGLVSGLGMLKDVVFAGSRLAVGDSYDELVDGRSGAHYYSGEQMRFLGKEKYHDFGYFASFPGPNGNHVLVISGMRDTGLMRTGETLTQAAGIEQLQSRIAASQPGFEALYEVYGLSGASIGAKLVLAGPLEVSRMWRDASRSLP
jgi:hypothetical protein